MLLVPRQDAHTRAAWLSELRGTLTLAWPLVLTNLAQIALTTTDVIILGRLGAEALAAGALGANLYFAILIFAIGLVTATSPMMARAFGAGRHVVRDVRRTFRQGLWTACIISMPSWLILWHAEAILLVLGQEPHLAAAGQEYMRGLQWGFLPFLGFIVLRSFMAALERPWWGLYASGVAIGFNAAANVVLVFGYLGFPALGMYGAGLATSLSNLFLFLALGIIVARHRQFRRYHLFGKWWRPDWNRLYALWRLGLPIGGALAFEVTVFNAAVFLMGHFGATAVAAHAIAIQIASVTFMVPMGLAQAATVRVGRAFGSGDGDAIARAGWTALGLAVTFMAMMSVLMIAAPNLLIGAFVEIDDPANAAVVSTATLFLICAAVFQVADGAQAVGAGMLRGLHDTRVPMLYAALGFWGIGLPLCMLLAFPAGLAGLGIWIGLAVSLTAAGCAMIVRWTRRSSLGLSPSESP